MQSRQSSAPDRQIRSLINLEANASTARMLNLIAVWKLNGDLDDYRRRPFFHNASLNRSIIVKHRLRQNERDIFTDGRSLGTKVILPLDITDLRSGARSFFVGQRGYRDILTELRCCDVQGTQKDERLLSAIDGLPSLDPFLMREHLRRAGFTPSRCYFDISGADSSRMFQFATREVSALVGKSSQGENSQILDKATKLATMMMSSSGQDDFEPLRVGLGMDKAAFDEGMFCWKGFIYYKWMLGDLLPKVQPVVTEIASVRAIGVVTGEDDRYIRMSQGRLANAVHVACETVRLTLKIYDDAFADLTVNGQPKAFREFLLNAPNLFFELGERLGAVEHIVSFWRYRFPVGRPIRVNAEELVDLFSDFETSISFTSLGRAA